MECVEVMVALRCIGSPNDFTRKANHIDDVEHYNAHGITVNE